MKGTHGFPDTSTISGSNLDCFRRPWYGFASSYQINRKFRPKVFAEGVYTVKVGEPGTDKMKVIKGVEASGVNNTVQLAIGFP